jgi:transcription elongation GreA/GreB family factor
MAWSVTAMKRKRCFVTDTDRCRLGVLLETCEGRAWGRANCLRTLDARLEDADFIDSTQTPRNLVTMNSIVELTDVSSGDRRQVTLAYPADCDLVPDSVSVFEPLGTQLLGSQVGDVVSYGKGEGCITRIIFQPESAGARHL